MKASFKLTVGAVMFAVVLFGCGGGGNIVVKTERGTFTDSRDGKTYSTVTIGSQIWMAENLNFATDEGSWCYDDNESNCDTYGRLYDWNTARTVCPNGWRLSSDDDWTALENAVGGSSTVGKKLKSQSGWAENGNGTDDYGFSALPGGYRWDGSFNYVGLDGGWWTATEDDATYARYRLMGYNLEGVYLFRGSKSYGFSVRCVRD